MQTPFCLSPVQHVIGVSMTVLQVLPDLKPATGLRLRASSVIRSHFPDTGILEVGLFAFQSCWNALSCSAMMSSLLLLGRNLERKEVDTCLLYNYCVLYLKLVPLLLSCSHSDKGRWRFNSSASAIWIAIPDANVPSPGISAFDSKQIRFNDKRCLMY